MRAWRNRVLMSTLDVFVPRSGYEYILVSAEDAKLITSESEVMRLAEVAGWVASGEVYDCWYDAADAAEDVPYLDDEGATQRRVDAYFKAFDAVKASYHEVEFEIGEETPPAGAIKLGRGRYCYKEEVKDVR